MSGKRLPIIAATALLLTSVAGAQQSAYVIQHARIVTVSGPVIQDGSVAIKDGRIADVGKTVNALAGARVIDARGLTVYPGLFDADSVLGMESPPEVGMGQFTPQLSPSTSFVVESERIPQVRWNGVTTVLARQARGTIPGQGDVMSLAGWSADEMLVKRQAAIVLVFPTVGELQYTDDERFGVTPNSANKAQYDRRLREIKDFFAEARAYLTARQERRAGVSVDDQFEAMIPVLEGKVPVIIEATNHVDIRNAVEFAKGEKLNYLLAALSDSWKAADFLKENSVRVLIGSTLDMPTGADDPYDVVYRTPAILHQKGVVFAMSTLAQRLSDPRLLAYYAGNAVAHGLPHDVALRSVTLTPAEFLGVADRLGSIDKGKIANLVVATGDIFEYRTEVKYVFINGQMVGPDTKDLRLYEKYRNRPALPPRKAAKGGTN